jgi:hypothetical protein
MMRRIAVAGSLAFAVVLGGVGASPAGAAPAAGTPTCSDTLGVVVHGQHIVADYVTGMGHMGAPWPPSGGIVGEMVSENGGVAVAGGPGPGFHFPNGFAPGASFCNDSSSPGTHL